MVTDPWSRAEEEFGIYVGPATQSEVIDAIAAHGATVGGVVIAFMHAPDGSLVWHRVSALERLISGWPKHGDPRVEQDDEDEDTRTSVFVFIDETQQTAGNPIVILDAPLVLDFHEDWGDRLQAERYSSGVRIHMGFGPHDGHTLTLVFWSTLKHVTESGDIAPGIGPFTVAEFKRINPGDDDETGGDA